MFDVVDAIYRQTLRRNILSKLSKQKCHTVIILSYIKQSWTGWNMWHY